MASQTIDKLQVEIEASARSLNTVFSQLQSHLSQLQKTINSIDTSKLTALSKSTNSVSINTSGISKAEKDISNSVSKIQQSLAGLESYKNAALSGDSSSLTSFNRRVISIQSNIDVLREKFSQLGDTRVETTAFTNLKTQADDLQAKLDGLNTKLNDVLNGTSSSSPEAFAQLKSDISLTEAELASVNTQMAEMVANGTATTDPFASYRDSLEQLQSTLNTTNAEVQKATADMNNKEVNIDTKAAKEALETLTSSIKDTVSNLWSLTKSGITAGIDGLKTSFSGLSTVVSGVKTGVSKLGSAFSTGVSKILKYGFGIRSTYVLFRRLRSYVVDAFTELQNSGAFFETTNANVDALSDSLSTLKYQFGAAFEPIFNTVAPALQTLINYLVAVMNTISAFIAKLTGASTYSKAVVATSEIADNTGSAASSAEDLNKQLQGFDELNNLSGDSDSGGGSGGSSSSDDSTITYVEESVDSALTSFWDSLSDAITSGDWWKVGSLISEELTDALNSIEWNDIFEVASDFGTNLASFMNGLISDDLFSALGTTIANSIKTALFAALSFSEKFSWTGLGNAIASGINAIMDAEPLSLAVTTANSWINGILDMLIAAVDNVSWSTLSNHIADAIGSLDTSSFGTKLGTFANELANALYTIVSNKDTWSNLGTKIGEGISSAFTAMNTVNSSTGKTGWQALGSSISSTISGIGTAITNALNSVSWEEVGQGIADFISSINWEEIKFTFTNLLSAIKSAIVGIIKGLNLSAEDVAGISIGIGSIAVTLLAISGLSLAASITKKVITDMIASAIMTKIGTSTGAAVSVGSIGSVVGTVGLGISLIVTGWKIGSLVYENATGKAAPSFGEIVSTLASDGAFGDLVNGIKLDLEGDASISWDLSSTLSMLTGNSATMTVSQLNVSTKKVKVDVDTSTTDSAMTFTNQLSLDTLLGGDFSEYGADIVKGVQNGASDETSKNSGNFWTGMWNEFKSLVVGGVASAFDMHSPAKVMYPYGENIVLGIVEGIKNKSTEDTFSGVISGLKSVIDSALGLSGLSTYNVTVTATQGTPDSSLKSMGNSFSDKIKKKWTNTHADIDADLGGDLEDNGINTFSTWESVFSTFKSIWTGASATFKAKTGGQISRITDLTSWQTTFENLYNAWNSKTAEFKAGYGSGTSASSIGTMKSVISGLTGAWVSKTSTYKADYASGTTESKINGMKNAISDLVGAWTSRATTYKATYENGTSENSINTMKSIISGLTGAWVGKTASFSATFDKTTETMQGYADAITAIKNSWTGANADFTLNANVNADSLNSVADTIASRLKQKLSGTMQVKVSLAEGGILTNGGWKSIPQYAGGSLDTGSLFWAGEQRDNPELVGHVNGRTEVLNKSQIASVMYASMSQAMRNFGTPTSPSSLSVNSASYSPYNGASSAGSRSDALIMEQNRLLQEQNRLLEEIASKETTIPISDIFSAIQSESNNYYNRTGSNAFVF